LIPESVKRYEARTPRSKALFERALEIAPGGVHHNIRYYSPYPIFIDRGKGSHFWDVDGNDYVDFWMGHGAHILGHAPAEVVEALQAQVAKSVHYGMPSEVQLSLGELIRKMVPSAEKIRYANTGTEATMYAVRFARAYTKRRKIAKFEGHWHGGHDILNVAVKAPFDKPSTAGALDETSAYTVPCPFNDVEGTLELLRGIRQDLACLIVEPVMMTGGALPADRDFLKAVKEAVESYNAILVFDEVVTGFRLARGGAQELYGVEADLATYGKIIGGGCPIGAIAGRDEIMDVCNPAKGRPPSEVAQQGGTFCGNPMTMTGGYVALTTLNEHPEIYERIGKLGEEARRGVERALMEAGVPARSTGLGSMFITHFLKEPDAEVRNIRDVVSKTDRVKLQDYHVELMNQGVFFLPTHIGMVSSAHTEQEIRKLVEASRSFAALMKAQKA